MEVRGEHRFGRRHVAIVAAASLTYLAFAVPALGGDTSDTDGDGVTVQQGDCNDMAASIHPGAFDIPGDSIDQDCNTADATRMQTKITAAPAAHSHKRRPKIRFKALDGTYTPSTFECKVDAGAWKACASPKKLKRLGLARHVFKVRAIDSHAFKDPSPAKVAFKTLG